MTAAAISAEMIYRQLLGMAVNAQIRSPSILTIQMAIHAIQFCMCSIQDEESMLSSWATWGKLDIVGRHLRTHIINLAIRVFQSIDHPVNFSTKHNLIFA